MEKISAKKIASKNIITEQEIQDSFQERTKIKASMSLINEVLFRMIHLLGKIKKNGRILKLLNKGILLKTF